MHNDSSAAVKVCCNCKVEKQIDEFGVKIKSTGQRQSRCKACQRLASRAHYEANREAVKTRAKENRATLKTVLRALVTDSLKKAKCQCCTGNTNLTYLINPGYSGPRVSAAVNSGMAEATVKDAMANSRVLCRTCMQSQGARPLLNYMSRKQRGETIPPNPISRAEYKRRNTAASVDRRTSAFRTLAGE